MTGPTYTMSWDSTPVANGADMLAAVARDAAGNSTTSSPLTLNIVNASVSPTPSPTSAQPSSGGGCTVGDLKGDDPLLLTYAALALLVLASRRSKKASPDMRDTGRIEK